MCTKQFHSDCRYENANASLGVKLQYAVVGGVADADTTNETISLQLTSAAVPNKNVAVNVTDTTPITIPLENVCATDRPADAVVVTQSPSTQFSIMNVQQWQLQHANERASAATTEAVHSMPRALSVLRHLAQETHRMLQTPAMAAATCIDDGAVTCGALTCNPTTAYAQPCCGRRMH